MKVRPLNHLRCFVVIAVAAVAFGCQHARKYTLEPCDSTIGVPAGWLHESACLSAKLCPVDVEPDDLIPPRTIRNPEATEIWELKLSDAIGIALKNSDVVRTLVTGTDQVVASLTTIYDPAISEQQIQTALSVFDANWTTTAFWTRTDQPPGTTFGGGIPVPNQRDQAEFRSSLTKLLATGGTAGIAFNNNYIFVPPFGTNHPPAQYQPNVEFSLSQPLLKGGGVDYNRAPIVIARLQSDQSLWDLKQAVLGQVRSVEEAYWSLFAAHGVLRSLEDAIPLLQELVRIREEELKAQKVTGDLLAEAQSRFFEFQQQRIQAMAAVLQAEDALRNLMGLPPNDGRRLTPIDPAKDAPVLFDWPTSVRTALDYRPDIVRQRLAVRIRELELLRANNALQPQLDVQGLWRINGLDHELDDAIGVLTDNQFTDWQLGFTFSVPLGFRQASAEVHASQLRLDKDRALLRQSVHSTTHELSEILRNIDSLISQYQVAERRFESSLVWVEIARTKALPELAIGDLAEKQNLYIQAIEEFRNSSVEVRRVLSQYNTALARFEEVKGTLLATSGIQLVEDPVARVRLQNTRLAPAGTITDEATNN